jgi:hypothetical protein
VGNLQTVLNRLGEWASENEMIINPAKSKADCFTKARVTESLNYPSGDRVVSKANSSKYLGIFRSHFSWDDQVNYTVKKAWKAIYFTIRIIKHGNINNKIFA